MQYQIQTAPLWEAYRDGDGCPLCKIFLNKQTRLVKSYLDENVMDPDFRERSNAVGFCSQHIRMMYAGENKLGLALQLETRAEYLANLIKAAPRDKKSAKKTAAALEAHNGCVICSELDDFMPRYYMTVASMFDNEAEFPELFAAAKHCLKHATMLFDASEYAGKSVARYLSVLTEGLKTNLENTKTDLRRFADCFDHKSSMRPDPDVPPRAIELIIGEKLRR